MNKTIYSKEHKRIVEKLLKARKEANLEQEEVALLIGKTQSYISKIETGQRKIDVVTLKELSKIYKKDVNFFINKS